MEEEIYETGEFRHIAGIRIPSYDRYCPITLAYVLKNDAGEYVLSEDDDPEGKIRFDEAAFIDNPGFLIVHLGHLNENIPLKPQQELCIPRSTRYSPLAMSR